MWQPCFKAHMQYIVHYTEKYMIATTGINSNQFRLPARFNNSYHNEDISFPFFLQCSSYSRIFKLGIRYFNLQRIRHVSFRKASVLSLWGHGYCVLVFWSINTIRYFSLQFEVLLFSHSVVQNVLQTILDVTVPTKENISLIILRVISANSKPKT